ncbi:MAG: ATP-dependent Clp protease ATP-binding subunit, partial [Firmicutes bacterium]|nr:ATP-dependent Clp protease ATP-binding subunit [Bacillota bacterium]
MIPPQFLNMLKGATHPGEDDEDEPGEDDLSPSASASAPSQDEKSTQEEDPAQAKAKARRKRNERLKTLSKFGTNLTDKAEDGEIDGVIGRENEIDRLMQILNRRTKNNPVLLGEPGVGKTAIAEGFALKIARGEVPVKLRDKQVVLLDMTGLVAGTQFRGQFEARMKAIINEVTAAKNVILVIDEIHNLVGAGDAQNSMNAANILKPALANGSIQIIGTTTLDEYRRYIEKDAALERRFQPIIVDEPTREEAVAILKGIRSHYEDYHNV